MTPTAYRVSNKREKTDKRNRIWHEAEFTGGGGYSLKHERTGDFSGCQDSSEMA